MSARVLAIACLLVAPGASVATGQAVQLPTFQYFSVQTSVLAPDRGGTYLGGVGRSSSRSSAYGVPGASQLPGMGRLFGNRALNHSASGGNASVHVTIIDHEALDQAVLAEAAQYRPGTSSEDVRAADSSQRMNRRSDSPSAAAEPLLSVAELRRRNEARRVAESGEAARLVAQARQAENRGQTSTARIYYQLAWKKADPKLQGDIATRLQALRASAK